MALQPNVVVYSSLNQSIINNKLIDYYQKNGYSFVAPDRSVGSGSAHQSSLTPHQTSLFYQLPSDHPQFDLQLFNTNHCPQIQWFHRSFIRIATHIISQLPPVTRRNITILMPQRISVLPVLTIHIVVVELALIVNLRLCLPRLIHSPAAKANASNDGDKHQKSEETHQHKHENSRHLAHTHADDAVEKHGKEAGNKQTKHDFDEGRVTMRRLLYHLRQLISLRITITLQCSGSIFIELLLKQRLLFCRTKSRYCDTAYTLTRQIIIIISVTMPYYSVLSITQILIMTLALQISSLFSLPIILNCFKTKTTHFEAILFSMTLLASFMFHTCEIYQTQLFLSELQWQRIDNIFTISSFEIVILHLCGAIEGDSLILKLAAVFSTVIIQEKDPWNFTYTALPLISSIFVGLLIRIYNRKRRTVTIKIKNIVVATSLLVIGCYFFVAGLQQEQDYLRLNHAAWHIFGSSFGYFCLNAVAVQKLKYLKLDSKQSAQ